MGQLEHKKIQEILSTLKENQRFFRINAGRGWVGEIIKQTGNIIILKNYRPFIGAPTGFPDLIGWETIKITEDMIGKEIAIFSAKEVKVTSKIKKKSPQDFFRNILIKMGGIFEEVKD